MVWDSVTGTEVTGDVSSNVVDPDGHTLTFSESPTSLTAFDDISASGDYSVTIHEPGFHGLVYTADDSYPNGVATGEIYIYAFAPLMELESEAIFYEGAEFIRLTTGDTFKAADPLVPNSLASAADRVIETVEVDSDDDGIFEYSYSVPTGNTSDHLFIDIPADDFVTATSPDGPWPLEEFKTDLAIRLVDDNGEAVTTTVELQVIDSPPIIELTVPEYEHVFDTFTLDVNIQDPGPDEITEVEIDWGDGTIDTHPGSSSTAFTGSYTHSFTAPGHHEIRVSVKTDDKDGEFLIGEVAAIEVFDLPRPYINGAETIFPNAGGPATITILEAIRPTQGTVLLPGEVEWDADMDGAFGGVNDITGFSLSGIPQGPYGEYRAHVKLTDTTTGITQTAYFDFLPDYDNADFVDANHKKQALEAIEIQALPHRQERWDDFDVEAVYQLVHQLRPDVYDWWNNRNAATIERIHARSWIDGWFWLDVKPQWKETGLAKNNRPMLRVDLEYSEIEVAHMIIEEVTEGWFKDEFNAHNLLLNANDFETVEAFAKWREHYVQEIAGITAFGAKATLDLYSMAFSGADIVMTANDIANDGKVQWYHAAELIRFIPVLGKLGTRIRLKLSNGDEVATIAIRKNGTLNVIRSGAFIENAATAFTQVFPSASQLNSSTYIRNIISQTSTCKCGQTSVQMIMEDVGLTSERYWEHLKPFAGLATSKDVQAEIITKTIDNVEDIVHPFYYLRNVRTKSHVRIREILEQANKHPVIVTIDASLNGNAVDAATGMHAVVVDGSFVGDLGQTMVKVRDPGSGAAWAIKQSDFLRRLRAKADDGSIVQAVSDMVYFPHFNEQHIGRTYDDVVGDVNAIRLSGKRPDA